jgi:hypothetical protein
VAASIKTYLLKRNIFSHLNPNHLFSADATIFFEKENIFLPKKSWKNHPQKLLRYTQFFLFITALSCPNSPGGTILCSKCGL